jgi:hypothetical protein
VYVLLASFNPHVHGGRSACRFCGSRGIAKRHTKDVLGGVKKLPKNIKRTFPLKVKTVIDYDVQSDDREFFKQTIPQLPGLELEDGEEDLAVDHAEFDPLRHSVTNITQ